MVYGIFTAGQRTWGGPRADAGTADEKTTPQQAVEQAEAQGDDLAVIPETFRPAAEAQRSELRYRAGADTSGLQPDDRIEGRFAQSDRLPNGYYNYHVNDSMGTLPDQLNRNPNAPHIPLQPRASFDSFISGTSTSAGNSIYFPRRVESIMGEEDRRKYFVAQANQRQAGGAYMVESQPGETTTDELGYKKAVNISTDSVESSGSSYAFRSPNSFSKEYNPNNYSQPATRAGSPNEIQIGEITEQPVHLNTPEAAHRPQSNYSARSSSAVRSPLARLSLVRTAGSGHSDEGEASNEGPVSQSDGPLPAPLDTNEEREGRSKERKKLTKKPHH